MKSPEQKREKLPLVASFGISLAFIVLGWGIIIGIVHAVQYLISFIQNPSATWSATWSNITKESISHLGMFLQILIQLLFCGLFILVLVSVSKLYFWLLHGRKINKRLFPQEDLQNTNLRKLTYEMRELADEICQNNDPHTDLTLRIYRITITIEALTGRYSLIRRIIWNFTDLVSQIIIIVRLIVCGVYKTPKEKLSGDLLSAERILYDFLSQQCCSEYYKERISQSLRDLADKIDNNQTKIFNKAKCEIELLVQNKAVSATDSKSYRNLSKYQKYMFWVVHILAFSLLILFIGWVCFSAN